MMINISMTKMIADKYRTIAILILRNYVSLFRCGYKHILVSMIADKYRTIVTLVIRNYVSLFRCFYKHTLVINLEYCGMALRWTRRETHFWSKPLSIPFCPEPVHVPFGIKSQHKILSYFSMLWVVFFRLHWQWVAMPQYRSVHLHTTDMWWIPQSL